MKVQIHIIGQMAGNFLLAKKINASWKSTGFGNMKAIFDSKGQAKEAIKKGSKRKNKSNNINIHPGVLTSQDVFETENELGKQRGGGRKKVRSFLSGGTLLHDLRTIGNYLKK